MWGNGKTRKARRIRRAFSGQEDFPCLLPACTIGPLWTVRKPHFAFAGTLALFEEGLPAQEIHAKLRQANPLVQTGLYTKRGGARNEKPLRRGVKHQESLFRMRPAMTPTPMTPNTIMVKMLKCS
ncbi:hypothetical protein B5F76_08850 [Desulfovibrio sp. An276]|nr:hypothetical protein B5F76_08850 [Desulfovibrio sp. An276]